MRKFISIILFVVILLLTFSISACVWEPETWGYSSEDLMKNTIEVELVYIHNDNPIFHDDSIFCKDDKIESCEKINFDEVILIQTLDKSQHSAFFDQLAKVPFYKDRYFGVDYPTGYTLLLHQENGEIILISWYSTPESNYSLHARFDSNGNFIEQYPAIFLLIPFEDLILEFFGINIYEPLKMD